MSTASKLLAEQYQSVLEEIKPAVSEAVFERLNESIRRNQELLECLQRENKLLRALRRLDLLEKYGPSAEALSDELLELLELEPGVSTTEIEAESQRTQLSLPLKSAPARKHPGRQQLPAELPREEQVIACASDQCVCGKCGKETTVIGYETSEQLDIEPAKYFVRVTKREKRACKACEEQGVQCAPLPTRIIDKVGELLTPIVSNMGIGASQDIRAGHARVDDVAHLACV